MSEFTNQITTNVDLKKENHVNIILSKENVLHNLNIRVIKNVLVVVVLIKSSFELILEDTLKSGYL